MGEVWVARNQRTQRDFAIKVMLSSLAGNAEAVQRFVLEARATGQLQHPSIVQVFDAGKTPDGRPYLVMELLFGESLAQRLERAGLMSPAETCVMAAQIARALEQAHGAGIVHRDLSSANIFLCQDPAGGYPIPKILDFGVSKMRSEARGFTVHGSLLGSPYYMAPEQAEGAERVDARADIWSLGVLIYQCVTGVLPFRGRSQQAVMLAAISAPHVPLAQRQPALDPDLAEVVEACLVKDRAHRLRSAGELARRLEAIGSRLVNQLDDQRGTPRRRLADRLSPPLTSTLRPARWRRSLVPSPFRRWQSPAGSGFSRAWTVAGMGLVGTLFGIAIGVAVAQGARAEVKLLRTAGPRAPVVVQPGPAGSEFVVRVEELPNQPRKESGLPLGRVSGGRSQ